MNSSPVCAARSRKYPSNISFQAAAWTVAVRVSTPSRSNRQARTLSGKPITASPSALSCDLSLPHAPPSDTSPLALGSSQYDSCPPTAFSNPVPAYSHTVGRDRPLHHSGGVRMRASAHTEMLLGRRCGEGVGRVLSGTFSGVKLAYLPSDHDLGVIIEIFEGTPGAEQGQDAT